MEKIKSFLYLDYDKMYSLASQLFEGIIDTVTEIKRNNTEQTETQLGPLLSGRTLSDVITNDLVRNESRYLHDYIYVMFEKELINRNMVLIESNNAEEKHLSNPDARIVKVSGRAIFYDSVDLRKVVNEFLNIIDKIVFFTTRDDLKKAGAEMKQILDAEKDKNKRKTLENRLKAQLINAIKDKTLELSQGVDAEFLKNVDFMLNYSLGDLFETHVIRDDSTYSAVLKREYFKENHQSILHKFSRSSEVELTLFGIITQSSDYNSNQDKVNVVSSESPNIKEVFMNILYTMIDVDNSLIGKKKGQIIMDPIALYMDV